jgi:hypothetical protein
MSCEHCTRFKLKKNYVSEQLIKSVSKQATWMFQITAQWQGVTTRRLLLRDYNSQNRCCGGAHYGGPRQFHQQNNGNRRLDYDPSFTTHRHEYHTDSRNHQYDDDDYYYYYKPNKLKYSDHKSPPLKYPYHKEYSARLYNNPSLTKTKYMQKRTGFVFPDTYNNINDGRGGYRPYIPPSNFQDHRYHDNDFNNFRNKNGHQGYHDLTEDTHRQKYRPALLGVSVGTSGGVVVTGPDGYKHVIHSLPPWTEPNTTPETEHYRGTFHPRGSSEHLGSHRFTTGFRGSPGVYEHQTYHHQTYKGVPTYYLNSHIKNRNQEQGVPKYTSDILHQTHNRGEKYYKVPSKPDNFQPSPPFHRYSEPDPLHHPNGSPLQKYSPTEPTQLLTTTSSNASTTSEQHKVVSNSIPEKPLKYPHSINAQLPPSALDTDTTVPYVATEQIPNHHVTTATQVSDANNNTSFIQVLPTEPPGQRSTESEVSSSTVMENKTLPVSLIQETSMNPEPAKVSIHPTQTVQTDSNMTIEHFLPTVITEKSYVTPHQSTHSQTFNMNMTVPSHNIMNHKTVPPPSPQELLDVIQKSNIKQTSSDEKKNYTASVYVTAVAPVLSSSSTNTSASGFTGTAMPTEGNTVETLVTQTAHSSIETKTEDNSNLTEDPNSDSEDVQPTVETFTTEEATYTTTNEPNLHGPSMLKELQALMNHAQSLNYLYQDSSTTVSPTDGRDQ